MRTMQWAWQSFPALIISGAESSEAVYQHIERITPPEILLEVANGMFSQDYLSTLIYH